MLRVVLRLARMLAPPCHFNLRAPQNLETFARVFRIRIGGADDDAPDAGGDDGIRARRRATVRATRFERDVKCRAARIVAAFLRVAERLDFRMRQTGALMPATPDDFPAFHQHCADHRNWRSRAVAAPGKPEGVSHEL